MNYCIKCGSYIGTAVHRCPGFYNVPQQVSPWTIPRGNKCDVCGSTAIDHTESQCSMNRQFKALRGRNAQLPKEAPKKKGQR